MTISFIDYLLDQSSYDAYVRERLAEIYKEIFFDLDFYETVWNYIEDMKSGAIKTLDFVAMMHDFALQKAKEEISENKILKREEKNYLLEKLENVSVDGAYGYTVYEGIDEFFDSLKEIDLSVKFESIGDCCKFLSDIKKYGLRKIVEKGENYVD